VPFEDIELTVEERLAIDTEVSHTNRSGADREETTAVRAKSLCGEGGKKKGNLKYLFLLKGRAARSRESHGCLKGGEERDFSVDLSQG